MSLSDDPLMLSGLSQSNIEEQVELRKMTKKAKDPIAAKNAETAAKREERLTNKLSDSGSSNHATSQPPPPPVKQVDKSAMLDKLEAYRERFPHLKSRNKLSGKSTAEEIADELHYVQQQLGQKDGHMGNHLFLLAMSGIEEGSRVYNPLNLNLTGLSQICRENQDQFTPILDELFIKYGATMYVGPEMRLVMATATMIYTVHAANTGNPAVAQALAKMNQRTNPPHTDL